MNEQEEQRMEVIEKELLDYWEMSPEDVQTVMETIKAIKEKRKDNHEIQSITKNDGRGGRGR